MVVRAIIVVLIIHSHVKKRDHHQSFGSFSRLKWQDGGTGGGGLGPGHTSKSQPFFSHNDFVVVAKRRPNKTARKKDVNFSSSILYYIPIQVLFDSIQKIRVDFFGFCQQYQHLNSSSSLNTTYISTQSRKTILHLLIKVKSYEKVTQTPLIGGSLFCDAHLE